MSILVKQLGIYYVIIFIANVVVTSDINDAAVNVTSLNPILLSAIKSPPIASFVSVHDRCTLLCHGHYFATDDEVSDIMERPWFTEDQFTKENLQILCPKLEEFKKCVQICHESPHKTAHLKYLTPIKFMCTKSFIETTPCYKRVFLATQEKCHGPSVCGQQMDFAERNYDDVKIAHTGSLTSLFSSQCSYYQCYHPCIRSKMVRECGAGEYEIFKALSQSKIAAHREVWRRMGFEYDEPPNCRMFRNEDSDT